MPQINTINSEMAVKTNNNRETAARKNRVKPALGYISVGIICYVVFLAATFPYGKFTSRVEAAMESALNMDVAIQEMSLGLPASAELENVVLSSRVPEGIAPAASKKPFSIKLDRLKVSASLINLIRGIAKAEFSVKAFAGTAEGRFSSEDSQTIHLEATLKDIDTTKLVFLGKALGFKLEGMLSGKINMDTNVNDASSASGTIKLIIQNVHAKGIGYQSITLPDLDFKTVRMEIEMANGKASVTTIKADGDQLGISGQGMINLQPKLADSILSLRLTIEPTDTFKAEFPMIMMLDKDQKGNPMVNVSGTLAKPQVPIGR